MEITIPGVKVTPQDRIFVQAGSTVSNTIVRLEVISQKPDGQDFQSTLRVSPDSAGNLALTSQRTIDSVITSMAAHIQGGAPELGQCFVRAGVLRGGATAAFSTLALISNYLIATGVISWPYGKHIQPGEGTGTTVEINITNPAAAADWTHTVPDRHIIRPLACTFTLTTDANVANRVAVLQLRDPSADIVSTTQPDANQAASLAVAYSASINPIRESALGALARGIPLPEIRLPAGFDVHSQTIAIQAGDQFSAITLTFEEWVFPS